MKYSIKSPVTKPEPPVVYPFFAKGKYSGALAVILDSNHYMYLEPPTPTSRYCVVQEGAWTDGNSKVSNGQGYPASFNRIVGDITFTQE